METIVEKECSALGGLFQMIISDLKMGSPNWEDFLGKAAKLHSTLKATVFALTAFLDAFQKIADLATNARGATKDIGTALTRLCLRHRGVETKLKTFSSAIMDHLCIPLQERLEDWKKIAFQMDKDHAKEYKRVRQDIKKKSSDTLRLQKKVRKAGKSDMKKTLDCAIQDVNDKYHLLEETEKNAVRRALIEERSRYCLFVSCLRPVVESELATLYEVSHLQEVLDSLTKLTEDPLTLPLASEQVIIDIKSLDSSWSFQTPPSSPTSLGSRKSSMCSISSLNSSSSDSTKSHSPSHHRSRSLSQPPVGALRLTSVSSQDSGFTSQDTLFTRLPTPPPMELTNQVTEFSGGNTGENSGTPSSPFPPAPCVTSTWPNLQDTMQFERAASSILKSQRPHTISSAYEKMGHNRPSLTAHTFQPLQQALCTTNDSANTLISMCGSSLSQDELSLSTGSGNEDSTPTHVVHIPPIPERCPKGNESGPKIPDKPQILKQYVLKKTLQSSATGGLDVDPIYINVKELGNTPKMLPEPQNSGDLDKVAFHKDLAAALAQNVVLHQRPLKRVSSLNRQFSEPLSTPSNDCCIGVSGQQDFSGNQDTQRNEDISSLKVSQIPKPPPPPVRRSSTLSVTPPVVPPHKNNSSFIVSTTGIPSKHTSAGDDRLGNNETSWNVFSEVGDSTSAHAQLIQALNARLNVLQQQTELPESLKSSSFKNPPPPPPKEMSKHFTTAMASNKDLAGETFERTSRTDSLPRSQQPTAQTLKKSSRAHSIGGGDRESFVMNLNSKFIQNQTQLSGPQQLKRQEVTAIVNKYATSPRNPLSTAQRRASQPVFPDTIQVGKSPIYPILSSMEVTPELSVGSKVSDQQSQLHQKQTRVDRRCSLNLEHEFSRQSSFTYSNSSALPFPVHGRDGHPQSEMLESLEVGFPPMTDAAARVHNWLAGRQSSDLSHCRESLLGQIREGVNLRKAPSNDRSAPSL